MTQYSAPWDGTTTGDATLAPYDASLEWAEYWSVVSGSQYAPSDIGGVAAGSLNMLRPTVLGAAGAIDTGRALVDGTFYKNDALHTHALATPAASTRIDRIVLRKDWVARTVRTALLTGIEGGTAPLLTQTRGTTWEIPLGKYTITTAGAITVVDERDWVGTGVYRPTVVLDNSALYTLSTAGAGAAITFNEAEYDQYNLHDTGINPSRVTIVLPGLYEVSVFNPNWLYNGSPPGQADFAFFRLYKNGVAIGSQMTVYPAVWNNTGPVYHLASPVQLTQVISLEQGDYVELFGGSSFANLQIYTANGFQFAMKYLGPNKLTYLG